MIGSIVFPHGSQFGSLLQLSISIFAVTEVWLRPTDLSATGCDCGWIDDFISSILPSLLGADDNFVSIFLTFFVLPSI